MIKTTMLSVAITAILSMPAMAQAPSAADRSAGAYYGYQPQKPMPPRYRQRDYQPRAYPERRYPRQPRPAFPSPQQLDRMTPAEPLSEETIKQYYAERRARMEERLKRDREAASSYSTDFEKLQQHENETLKKMMDRAEQRGAAMLKRLQEQEQRSLERYKKYQETAAKSEKPAQPAQ